MIPALGFPVLNAMLGEAAEFVDLIPGQDEYYTWFAFVFILFAAIVGPELLIADKRSGVINLYLVRPLTTTDYVLGRWLAFFSVAFAMLLIPQLTLFVGLVLGAESQVDYIRDNWANLPRSAAVGRGAGRVRRNPYAQRVRVRGEARHRFRVRHRPGAHNLCRIEHRHGRNDVRKRKVGRAPIDQRLPRLRQRHHLRQGVNRSRQRRRPCRPAAAGLRGVGGVLAERGAAGSPAVGALPEVRAVTADRGRPTISVSHVSKWYGNVVAISDVSFGVFPGITGLLGPNGAGKTTLLRMMAGLSRVSEGEISVLDEPVRTNPQIYRRIGVMPEHDALYPFYTGREFVELSARLHGLPDVADAASRAIDMANLGDAQGRKVGGYSRGMRQRIRLAASLVHDPEVLLLDEPLNGTDPRQRIEFHSLLQRLSDEGRTILISSHILEEVETLAGSILLMVSGKLAAAGDFHAIREKLDERPYKVLIECDRPRVLAAALVALDVVESVAFEPGGALVALSKSVAELQRTVPRLAQSEQVRLTRLEPLDDSLESVFDYLVEA